MGHRVSNIQLKQGEFNECLVRVKKFSGTTFNAPDSLGSKYFMANFHLKPIPGCWIFQRLLYTRRGLRWHPFILGDLMPCSTIAEPHPNGTQLSGHCDGR